VENEPFGESIASEKLKFLHSLQSYKIFFIEQSVYEEGFSEFEIAL
jgi:hypothetical protein